MTNLHSRLVQVNTSAYRPQFYDTRIKMSLLKARLAAESGCPLVHVNDYKLSMKGKIVCPQCNGDVVRAPTRPADRPKVGRESSAFTAQRPSRKMGFKNAHHFAHKSKTQCKSWWLERCAFATRLARPEPMTAWHKGWQDLFKPENVEVIMTCNNVKHIADVMSNGHILEIQHSPISASEVLERESFYTTNGESLTWVVDGRSEKDCVVLGTTGDRRLVAIWARPRWWWHTQSVLLIDTNQGIFQVMNYSKNGVGLAKALSTMGWLGVRGGLTLPGAQSLEEMVVNRTTRLLSTSFTGVSSSTCISGDTYIHRELFKKLGMTWSRDGWVISHNINSEVLTLWHTVAKRIHGFDFLNWIVHRRVFSDALQSIGEIHHDA